jgi:predicted transcriptional regulator YheO
MNTKQFKQSLYPAEMPLAEQLRQDKKKVKRYTNDHSKKPFKAFIPERNAWIFAENETKLNKMRERLIEGYIPPVRANRPETRDEIIKELYDKYTMSEIAKELKISTTTVYRSLVRSGSR